MSTFLVFVAAVLFLAVLPVGFWSFVFFRSAIDSRYWSATQAQITDSKIVSNRQCNGLPGWHYFIAYEYEIDGTSFRSTALRVTKWAYLPKAWAGRIVDAYPVGKKVLVTYDPDFPECSFVEPGWSWECLYPGLLLLLLLFASVGSFAAALLQFRGS